MPEVTIHLAAGRDPARKKALMKDIAAAVVKNLGVKPEVVVVQIIETPRADKSRGGIPFDEL